MDSHSIQDCTDELFTTPGRPVCASLGGVYSVAPMCSFSFPDLVLVGVPFVPPQNAGFGNHLPSLRLANLTPSRLPFFCLQFCSGCSVQPTPIDTASDTEGFVQAVIGPPEEVRYFRDGDYPSYTLYVERIFNVTTTFVFFFFFFFFFFLLSCGCSPAKKHPPLTLNLDTHPT